MTPNAENLAARLRATMMRHGARTNAQEKVGERRYKRHSVEVDVLSGTVAVHGRHVRLPPAALAVIMCLSIHDRPMSREALADALYPQAEQDAAMNALKVNLHRVRRLIGFHNVITCDSGRYAIGWCVDVDLSHIEGAVRAARRNGVSSGETSRMLVQIHRRLAPGRPACASGWTWFEETERRINQLGYEVTLLLARHALSERRFEDVFSLTSVLLRGDPMDELAVELAIRASVQSGDRIGAISQFRNFEAALRNELRERPPDALRRLLDQPAAS